MVAAEAEHERPTLAAADSFRAAERRLERGVRTGPGVLGGWGCVSGSRTTTESSEDESVTSARAREAPRPARVPFADLRPRGVRLGPRVLGSAAEDADFPVLGDAPRLVAQGVRVGPGVVGSADKGPSMALSSGAALLFLLAAFFFGAGEAPGRPPRSIADLTAQEAAARPSATN